MKRSFLPCGRMIIFHFHGITIPEERQLVYQTKDWNDISNGIPFIPLFQFTKSVLGHIDWQLHFCSVTIAVRSVADILEGKGQEWLDY